MQSKQYILHSLLWESAWTLQWTKKLVWRSGRSHGGHLFSPWSSWLSSKPPPPPPPYIKKRIFKTSLRKQEKRKIPIKDKCERSVFTNHDSSAFGFDISNYGGLLIIYSQFWRQKREPFFYTFLWRKRKEGWGTFVVVGGGWGRDGVGGVWRCGMCLSWA